MRRVSGSPAPGPSRGAAAAVLFCGALYGACSHDWDTYDPRLGPDGGLGGDAAPTASSSSAAGATGGGPASSTSASSSASSGATGGTGGAPDVCGNGIIGPLEECDDMNSDATDGCDACQVICDGIDEHEDPATHHCYALLAASSWSTAVTACTAWGGHLATVTTQAELDFVRTFVVQASWLGGNDIAMRGTWVWDDGEPWSFAPWNEGEPNNYGPDGSLGDEDCLDLFDDTDTPEPFGFNDDTCTHLEPPMCERDPPGTPK